MKKEVNKGGSLQPSPKVLVSCRGLNGEENALSVAYCGNCSYDPPMLMVGIVPSRYSYKMIKESGCFVVNVVEKDYEEVFNYLGSVSKKDEDKLEKMNVKRADGVVVNAPILTDCPVNIECKVKSIEHLGSHDMFIADIVGVNVDESLLDEKGKLHLAKAGLCAYAHGEYFELGKKVGSFGYSVRKKPITKGRPAYKGKSKKK